MNCTDTPLPGGVIYVLAEIVPSSLSFWCWASQLPQLLSTHSSSSVKCTLAGKFSVGLEYCNFKQRF